MTRILLTYSNVAERKLAARRACRLSARGIDVDLATTAAAARLPAAAYDRVLEASSCEPVPADARDHEGIVYIATAGVDRIPRARAPVTTRQPAKRADMIVALVVGVVAALALTPLVLPLFYSIGFGALVVLATFGVLSELHAPPPFADRLADRIAGRAPAAGAAR